MSKSLLLSWLASGILTLSGAALAADIPNACQSFTPAVAGGPLPPLQSDTVVIRWLGNANFEFAYKGKVYLFDAYFDRTPRSHELGFDAADVSTAEAIFVSHAHFDHISDIGPVAKQTGAPVVGAPITADIAKKLGAPEGQIVVAKGGETMHFGDATVEIALAQHSTIQPGLLDIYASLYKNDSPPYSEEEKKRLEYVQSLGTFDPKVITEGTLAYGLVLPSGFKAVLIGSAGPITPGVRALAERSMWRSLHIRCTRLLTHKLTTRGLSLSCLGRSFSFRRTMIRRRPLGSTLALSRSSTRFAETCQTPRS